MFHYRIYFKFTNSALSLTSESLGINSPWSLTLESKQLHVSTLDKNKLHVEQPFHLKRNVKFIGGAF